MAKKTPHHHSEKLDPDLVKELEDVVRLAQTAAQGAHAPRHCLAVMRLLSVSVPEWEAFASTHGLESWLAVPLTDEPAVAVNSLLAMQEKMARQRDTDALTGIPNRGYFDRKLNDEIERAVRLNSELSLITLDVDNFKRINDTYGHACGDVVLKRLGKILHDSIRAYDTTARVGGEEFAIILPGAPTWRAVNMATRILELFRQETFQCGGFSPFSVTFSAGVGTLSQLPKSENIHDALMKISDKALYEAKERGKNRVVAYEDASAAGSHDSLVQSHEKKFLFTSSGHGEE